jgi:hypothetical protein
MTRRNPSIQTLLSFAMALSLGASIPSARAAEFEEAELFLELNNTDGDLGLHALIDGGPYKRLQIEGPRGPSARLLLNLEAAGPLAAQGLTELAFESAEPPFDELPPEQFFRRFPEGIYDIEGISLNNRQFGATVRLSHVLAAPVRHVTLSGEPAANDCDERPLPRVNEPVLIDWDPVTTSHPRIGDPGPAEIDKYQLFVERGEVILSLDLPPTVTQFRVPENFTVAGERYKFEIIARTSTGNNTAIESCFIVAE